MDDQSLPKSYDSSTPSPRAIRKSRRLVLMIFLFIVIVGGVIAGKNYLGGGAKEEKMSPTPTPSENEIRFIIETPTASSPTETPMPIKAEAATPTPVPTVDPIDKETGLDRSGISIEVLNGSGVTGAANQASDKLKSFGYKISSIGNAEATDYENVSIKIKSEKSNFLDLLKKDLGFSYTIGSSSADLTDDYGSDALVIVGK